MEVTLEAIAGLMLTAVGISLGVMHKWRMELRADLCRDLADVRQDIKESRKEQQESRMEQREYFQVREKIVTELDQRLSRVEGRNIERDTSHRDSMAYNSKQKEVHFDDE